MEKIFVGLARHNGDKSACILFPGTTRPEISLSVDNLAYAQAQTLGHGWQNTTCYAPPVKEVQDGNERFVLEEFTSKSKRRFERSMSEALNSLHD